MVIKIEEKKIGNISESEKVTHAVNFKATVTGLYETYQQKTRLSAAHGPPHITIIKSLPSRGI